MEFWVSLTKIVQSLVTSIALIAGGIWAYYKFVSGRINKPRMELDVECAQHITDGKIVRLNVKVSLKNLGLSKIAIDQESTALRVNKATIRNNSDANIDGVQEIQWNHVGTFSLFYEHQWIEPSEVIHDQKMVECMHNGDVFKIEAIDMTKKQEWYAACISALDDASNKLHERGGICRTSEAKKNAMKRELNE